MIEHYDTYSSKLDDVFHMHDAMLVVCRQHTVVHTVDDRHQLPQVICSPRTLQHKTISNITLINNLLQCHTTLSKVKNS